jgi:RES domain-containing protein
MREDIPASLMTVAGYQSGVISHRQASDSGLSRSAIRAKIVAGRWRPVHRGVYATFTGSLDRNGQLWAAVLYAGKGAVLSHETAAEVHELITGRSSAIHVTIPHARQVHAVDGMTVHRSERAPSARWRLPPWEIPRTWVEDTIFDLAEDRDLDDVCALVTRAFARKRTSREVMLLMLNQRKRQRWRHEIEELVTEAADGTQSVLEFRYDRDVEQAHGLPRSKRQVAFVKRDGRKGYRDRVYDDYQVIVELDGKQAHPGDMQWADKRRDNEAAVDGHQSLRYSWADVRVDSCGTALQVAEVLRWHGWTGEPKPCSRTCPVARAGQRAGEGAEERVGKPAEPARSE